jgi:hypothetical protein
VLSNVSGTFTAPGLVIGANSAADWGILTITPDVVIATVTVTPQPNTANTSTDYGFTTSIVEFPDTI